MRKRIIASHDPHGTLPESGWLNLEDLAEVEITSEDPQHSIESALVPGRSTGWRAAAPGKQTIRLLFAQPQRLRRIRLHFVEAQNERSQEYVLRWSPDGGQTYQEIVRQQWNFNPRGATSETEDHQVELRAVTVLELSIIPDRGGRKTFASLEQLRIA